MPTPPNPNPHSANATPPRLLLVKFGAIGDVLMTLPAAHAMHQAGYIVDWLCSATIAPVLALYPWINVLPVDEQTLLRGSLPHRLAAIFALWRRLAGLHYDLCATLYYDRRYKLLTLPVRARRKLSLSKLHRATHLLPGRHHTDEYARIISGRDDSDIPTQLAPVRVLGLPPNPLPLVPGKARIVLVPAGARNTLRDDALRRWPVEYYVELARLLLQNDCEVVLAGGPGDLWASPHFAALPITDLTARLSLLEMLALLDSAAVTITHDTGPLHLAGLTSSAIVALFGPTDPRGRLPQRANCLALWGGEGFACRPCYDGRDYAPCTHNGCIRQLTPSLVFAETQTLLAAIAQSIALPPRVATPQHTPSPAFVTLQEFRP